MYSMKEALNSQVKEVNQQVPQGFLKRVAWNISKEGRAHKEAQRLNERKQYCAEFVVETANLASRLKNDLEKHPKGVASVEVFAWDEKTAIRNGAELVMGHLGAESDMAKYTEADPTAVRDNQDSSFWQGGDAVSVIPTRGGKPFKATTTPYNVGNIWTPEQPIDGLNVLLAVNAGIVGGGASFGTLLVAKEGVQTDLHQKAETLLGEQYVRDVIIERSNREPY